MDEQLHKKLLEGLTKAFDAGVAKIDDQWLEHQERAAYMSATAAAAEALIKLEQTPKKKKVSPVKPAL
jgi:hypothetical protein